MPTIYDKITDQIANAIEQGAGSWTMPWHGRGAAMGVPVNASTGNGYQGANALVLWCQAEGCNYTTPTWATYKQWQALGAQVRKGEHGTACIKWKEIEDKRRPADAGDKGRRCLIGMGFVVFNADQVDGWEGAIPESEKVDKTKQLAHVEQVIAASGAKITHAGARSFYRPSTDEIVLPERWRFVDTKTRDATEGYYSTLLHELTHWTGAESRCNRSLRNRFGDEAYAAEELIAELGAAFACARLGITNEPRPDHAAYLAGWLKALRNDSRAIFTAASQAQKACDYLLNRLPATVAEPLPIAA
jgi:antirestriction protein ArdC